MKRWWKRAYKPQSLQGAIHLVLVNTNSVPVLGCFLRMTQQSSFAKDVPAFFLLLFYQAAFPREAKYFRLGKPEKFSQVSSPPVCGAHTAIQTENTYLKGQGGYMESNCRYFNNE